MRRRLLAFVGSLRAHGLAVSVAETMDALAAVGHAGVERDVLRDALAATLVKDERDRPLFDPLFEAAFPLRRARPAAAPARPGRGGRGGGDGGAGGRAGGAGGGRTGPAARAAARRPRLRPATCAAARRRRRRRAARRRTRRRRPGGGRCRLPGRPGSGAAAATRAHGAAVPGSPGTRLEPTTTRPWAPATARGGAGPQARRAQAPGAADRAAQRARCWRSRSPAGPPDDLVAARDVVAELARDLRPPPRAARAGGPPRAADLRRTLRAAAATGGVPLVVRRRTRRPERPDLLVLGDVSGSVATASTLCLGLLAPATSHFRRVHLFAFVDRLCPVSVEDGHVVPAGPLDLWARSDFGRVLGDLWRDAAPLLGRTTVVLVVGDARNNRRPPRADLLRALHARVQRLVWLVPEPRARWNTGDSVLGRYAEHCDAVLECTELAGLAAAVRRVL
ncbi:MAG: VWA domain-containing protein [bacterium]|nr:VWA domain-containing protein [bacterium]